jgi:hypothetical protein
MGTYLMGMHLIGVCLTGVYPIGVHLIGVYLIGVYLICEPSLRAGHGGENPYIDPEDILKLLIIGDSAVRLLVTLGVRSAW